MVRFEVKRQKELNSGIVSLGSGSTINGIVSGDWTLGGNLTFIGTHNITATAIVSGNLTSGRFDLQSGSTLNSTVGGNPTFIGGVTFSSGITANGGIAFASGAPQVSGLYVHQSGGLYQASGLLVTHSGGLYQVSGNYSTGADKQASGLYVTHSGGLYQPSGAAADLSTRQVSGLYVTHSGGLYQASGIFQVSGVFQTSGLYVTHSGGFYQRSGIFQVSGDYPLASTKQASGIYQVSGDYPLSSTKQVSGLYVTHSGGMYQTSGIYPTSGVYALSGAAGGIAGTVATRASPGSVIVYRSGSTYTAETRDGTVLVSTTSGADVAINRAISNIPGATSGSYAGRVFIHRGDFVCVSGIMASAHLSGNYHGVSLVGEGAGTKLIFRPLSGQRLTNGIEMRMLYPQLKDMMLWADASGVTNLFFGGGGSGVATQFNWGVLENVSFNGRNSDIPEGGAATIEVSGRPISGQVGVLLEGNLSGSYFTANWKVHNCEFFALDTGLYIKGLYSDMCNHSNIHIGGCNVGYKIEGTQHNLVNFRIEAGGSPFEVGTIGIWNRVDPVHGAGGTVNTFTNIQGELRGSGSVTILHDNGTANNRVINCVSTPANLMDKHNIVDNNKALGLNYEFQESDLPYTPFGRYRRGAVQFGLNPTGFETGILQGILHKQLDGVTNAFTALTADQGPALHMTTGTGNTSVACAFLNNATLGNTIVGGHFPSMTLRFIPVSVADCRVFIGLWNQFAAPTATADMLSGRAGVGLWLDTGVSSNWKLMHNDGTGASTVADFPTATLGDTTYQPNAVANSFVQGVTVNFGSTPSVSVRHHGLAYDFKTTNIPATSTSLGLLISIQNITAGASRILRLYDLTYDILTTG